MASVSDESSAEDRLSHVLNSSDTSCSSTITTLDDSTIDSSESCCSQNIRVVARIRPLSTKEQREQSKQVLIPHESTNSIQLDQGKCFEFDKVFHPSATQREVYEQTAGDMIQNHLFKGFNVTVLAYGQTGSGKTHTIFGGNGNKFGSDLNEELDGIIPRAVNELFRSIGSSGSEDTIKVDMSFLEIYNEEAKDLLSNNPSQGDLSIREGIDGVVVKNLSRHSVVSSREVATLMLSAAEKRSTASTLMNEVSSRSHAICTLYVTMSPLTNSGKTCGEKISAKLTLVDLAGSERVKKTGAEGMRLKEGININKGLFVLGQVVSALSELGQQISSDGSTSSSIHVNYRDSKLTRLLQDSLGGNSKTVMVACVSPADSNLDESTNTLRYAERTRSIKNSAIRNIVATSISPSEAAALRKENQTLKLQLHQAQTKLNTASSSVAITNTTQSIINLLSTKNGNSECPSFVKDEINGLAVRELDVVTKLMLHCSAMEEKANQLEKETKLVMDESLKTSLKADEWQLKYESLVSQIKDSDALEPETAIVESHSNMLSVTKDLRKEVLELKEKLRDAGIDAEVSRATAAAVLNGKGDLKVAETIALVNDNIDEDDVHDDESNLSAELAAMSGSIERKEIMIRSANQERECLETMRSHFEGALTALQDEVIVLSNEKEALQAKINSGTTKIYQVRGLKHRITDLEKRMKELKQKESEHKKALRLREQAEKKIQKLEAEIMEDKKKRTELQRKLKEGNIERRNERKEAKLNAAKYIRDSNRIQRELMKVKESAARQENVLRRRAEEALKKQKRLEEQSKKRPYQQSSNGGISFERKEEIKSWIVSEVNERVNAPHSKPTQFHDIPLLQTLDHSELRHASHILLQCAVENSNKFDVRKLPKRKKRQDTAVVEPVFFDDGGDDEEGLNEDSDSDWSPDTPAPRKKMKRSKEISDSSSATSNEYVSDEENLELYKNMTVNKLRELLRQSGLTVSGKKADLIKRLQYSARAKKALVCTQATESTNSSTSSTSSAASKQTSIFVDFKNIQNIQNITSSTTKADRKRPVSKQGRNVGSSKKMKLCQETISSSLRKRSPISSVDSSFLSSSAPFSTTKKSPRLAINSTQSSVRRVSPQNSTNSVKSSKCLSPVGKATRSALRKKASRNSPTSTTSLRSLRSRSSDESSTTSRKRRNIDHTTKPIPLSTITNSAKKRKSNRRASMKKSVNKALLQLEQLEQIL